MTAGRGGHQPAPATAIGQPPAASGRPEAVTSLLHFLQKQRRFVPTQCAAPARRVPRVPEWLRQLLALAPSA